MSLFREIKWPLFLVAGLGTQVFLLLADVIFVTYYGQLTVPGQDQAFYDKFALDTAPAFVFTFAPFPLYIITRWLCAKATGNYYAVALLYFGALILIELLMYVILGALQSVLTPGFWIITTSKLCGIMAGGHFATRRAKG